MTFEAIRHQLVALFTDAVSRGVREVEVSSWALHRYAGADAATDGDIHTCCAVLGDERCADDEVIHQSAAAEIPPSLTVRYKLPR